MAKSKLIAIAGIACLTFGLVSCGDNAKVHTANELLPALLTVSDMPAELNSTPVEWHENMRTVITNPSAPWENTLDPYLCSEAGTPAALTKQQAQLELTGGSVMEILLSSSDAKNLYSELDDAYKKCAGTTTLAYVALPNFDVVGDESATFKSAKGVVTITRVGHDIMILKWWVGEYYEQVADDYPGIVDKAVEKLKAL